MLPDFGFTLVHLLCFMAFDSVVYFTMALYIDDVRPGRYGVPKVWYYPVKVSAGDTTLYQGQSMLYSR